MSAEEKALRRTLGETTRRWREADAQAARQRQVNLILARQVVDLKAEIERLRQGYQGVTLTGWEARHVDGREQRRPLYAGAWRSTPQGVATEDTGTASEAAPAL